MMSRSCRALTAALSLLVAMPALAADNYTIQSGGKSVPIRTKEIGGVQHPMSIAIDGAGLERFTNANPGYVAFPSGTVLPISATTLPLPAGAATAAAQTTGNGSLATIATNTAGLATAAGQVTGNAALGAPSDAAWDGSSANASITSILKGLPRTAGGGSSGLPAGASTSALQTAGNTSLSSLDAKTPALASGRVPVDGSAVTQPVSASVLPLPTGAATSALQTAANTSLAGIASNTTGLATAAAAGTASDVAWDGSAASATQTSILKAIWSKLSGLLTVDTVVRSTSTDRGGTIVTAGTSQQFMAANAARRGVIYQNQSTGDLYVNCTGTAAPNQTSLKLPAGAIYESNPHHSGTGACSIYGATAGQAFYAREF